VNLAMIYLWVGLGVATVVALAFVGLQIKSANARVSRSIDPISQNAKTLKIELSALTRSRLDRQRRLENTGSKKTRSRK